MNSGLRDFKGPIHTSKYLGNKNNCINTDRYIKYTVKYKCTETRFFIENIEDCTKFKINTYYFGHNFLIFNGNIIPW